MGDGDSALTPMLAGVHPGPLDLRAVDFGGAHVEMEIGEAAAGVRELALSTDALGPVLLSWQVRLVAGGSWELPPRPWPPDSGADAGSLQTMVRPVGAGPSPWAALRVALPPCAALRCQLVCLGAPEMRRRPLEALEIHVGTEAPVRGPSVACTVDAPDESSSSDGEGSSCICVRLRLMDAPGPPQRVTLPRPSLAALRAAAAEVFPQTATAKALELVGRAAGMSTRLDSDAALGVFLTSAAHEGLGAPEVELRPGPA